MGGIDFGGFEGLFGAAIGERPGDGERLLLGREEDGSRSVHDTGHSPNEVSHLRC